MKSFIITLTFTGSLEAKNEGQAQERADAISEALTKGLDTLKARWQAPDLESETEVEEE